MINWPSNLVSEIARRRCVLVLGSGISMNSANTAGRRPRTWKVFLESLLPEVAPNAHIKKLIKENDFLTACEVLKRALGRETFTDRIKEEFLTPGYIPAQIHEEIFKLDSRIVATPNFDKIYETYANSAANGTVVVKHQYDTEIDSEIRRAGRVVLKIHGSIDSPDKIIFTRAEYAEARTQYSTFYEILEALALTHTFVFLGCGVNDPDIRLLLEDSFFKHNGSRKHIMVLPRKSLHRSVIAVTEDTMNLKIVDYSDVNGHQELLDSIINLGIQVDAERINIQSNMNW